jgi:predicted GIY-YIG superfamily endonuclease
MLYLLHATLPVGGTGSNGARHYLGYSPSPSTLTRRVHAHRNGRGAHLTKALACVPGQRLLLANVWEGDRNHERLLKSLAQLWRVCPLCNPKAPGGSVTTPLPPPHKRAYRRRSVPLGRTTGVWRPFNKTPRATWSPPARPQASGT